MGKETLYEGFANLFKGAESVGGKLYLTEGELIHKPHAINIQTAQTVIPLHEILEVGVRNTLLLVPNGLSVKTRDGREFKFVVYKRKTWVEQINKAIKGSK
jgi:hypothetical protein